MRASVRATEKWTSQISDRYNDFKLSEMGEAMDLRKIYGAIAREFKCKWDFVPLSRFDELTGYLQGRIDRTILGKERGVRNYSSFEEFIAESR